MSGLGGLNRSAEGVVLGLVQLQLPTVRNPDELAAQAARIVAMVGKARRNLPSMDLVVFPEYALHGLSMTRCFGLLALDFGALSIELLPGKFAPSLFGHMTCLDPLGDVRGKDEAEVFLGLTHQR